MGDAARVRIGYAFGTRTRLNDDGFATVVDALERLGYDSLWLSERIGGLAPDPLVGMAFAAGRTTKLKFGMSVMVLPGRNPIVLAKELATLDRLSNGRLLPAFGLGVADPHEQQAFGCRASLARQAVRRGAGRAARSLGRRDVDPSRRALPLRRPARAAQASAGAPRRVAGRDRSVGAAPRRPLGRRMVAELRDARRRCTRARGRSKPWRPNTTERSTATTTAR